MTNETTTKCPDCHKLIALSFPLHECRIVIRYYVSPASTLRGWYVKRVVKVEGKETDDGWKEKFTTKREAKAVKDTYNKRLQKAGAYEAIS